MNSSELSTACVVGFFALPSPALAEVNPAAYTLAMAAAPVGAGSCAFCGTGIRNHVVVRLADGRTEFLGTDCAERVGTPELRRCVRVGLTSAQLAERDAREEARRAKLAAANQAAADARKARRAARIEEFRPVMERLAEWHRSGQRYAGEITFWRSLADQLAEGPLSPTQSRYVLKVMFGRRNKANAADYDLLVERLGA